MRKLYRYSDCNWYEEYTSADHLILDDYIVKRETNKGFWIVVNGKEKFVLSGEGKRFAYTNIELALKSYIKRKGMQIRINKNSIKKAKHMLGIALKIKDQIDSI
jgi:hypothetical protein